MSDIRPADARFPDPPKPEARREGIRVPPPPLPRAAVEMSRESPPPCDVSLVEETIRGRRKFPIGALLCGLLTLLVLALTVISNEITGLVCAAFPAALTAILLFARPSPFAFTVHAESLQFENPPLSLPYSAIQEVFAPERKSADSFAIHVLHTEGFITIPPRLNIPSETLYRFLANQPLALSDDRRAPVVLGEYLRLQESLFGPEHVWVYRARPGFSNTYVRAAMIIGVAGVVLGVPIAIVGGLSRDGGAAFAGGIVAAVFSLIMIIYYYVRGDGVPLGIRDWRSSCLVVSPGGMGLRQGHLKGELKWSEVSDLTHRKKRAFSVAGGQDSSPGVVVTVQGATFVIADIYHRPLEHVYKRMRRYWAEEREG